MMLLNKLDPQTRDRIRNLTGGAVSGVALTLAGHPFDTLKVRMQTEGVNGRFNGLLHCLRTTIKEEGVLALYKGATPPMIGMSIINSCMFTSMEVVKGYLHPDKTTPVKMSEIMIAGAITGWIVSLVATPIETIKSKLQVQYSGVKLYSGPFDCIRKTGIKGLYKAYISTGFQRTSLWAYFGGYEWAVRKLKDKETGKVGVLGAFMAGGVAGFCFWSTNFPFDVIRSRIMTQPIPAPGEQPRYTGTIDCAKKIYKNDGIKGFYKGYAACMLRTLPANGAAFVAYEFVMKVLLPINNTK